MLLTECHRICYLQLLHTPHTSPPRVCLTTHHLRIKEHMHRNTCRHNSFYQIINKKSKLAHPTRTRIPMPTFVILPT
ncbi:hypothetical protein I7I48_11878 [Histoplasma ohiense]|nr:hypothetical protein I7I48_11878 [Histoplasma ohiense (nom. inval.)]